MKKTHVIEYFGSQGKVAKALDIAQPSVAGWPDPIPEGQAGRLHVITDGALVYDPEYYRAMRNKPAGAAQIEPQASKDSKCANCDKEECICHPKSCNG